MRIKLYTNHMMITLKYTLYSQITTMGAETLSRPENYLKQNILDIIQSKRKNQQVIETPIEKIDIIDAKQWYRYPCLTYNNQKYHVIHPKIDFAVDNEAFYAHVPPIDTKNGEILLAGREKHGNLQTYQFDMESNKSRLEHVCKQLAAYLPKYKTAAVNKIVGRPHQKYSHTPIISIDEFLKGDAFICRHYSLIYALTISNLIKNNQINPGSIRIFSDILTSHKGSSLTGGHAWVMYHDFKEDKIYMLDGARQKKNIFELTNNSDMKEVLKTYGAGVIQPMLDTLKKMDEPSLGRFRAKLSLLERRQKLADKKAFEKELTQWHIVPRPDSNKAKQPQTKRGFKLF